MPPVLFQRGNSLVRVARDDGGRPSIERLDVDTFTDLASRSGRFVATNRHSGRARIVPPPTRVVRAALTRSDTGLPRLDSVIEAPTLRPDWSLLIEPGYDPATCTFYAPAPGLVVPPVSENPSLVEIKRALAKLREVFCDFPFYGGADRANVLAGLVTPVLRPRIAGGTPLLLLSKPKQGTGASLIADGIALVARGHANAMLALSQREEEVDKRLLSILAAGQSLVTFDNVSHTIDSPSLSVALTSDEYQGRLLGESRMVRVPQRTVFIATGNNLRVSTDLARRSYRVVLDAGVERPWEGRTFKHPNLRAWVVQQRGELLWAILTLARAWVRAGSPTAGVKELANFEDWCRTVGGMLTWAGVDGFLANQSSFYEDADEEGTEWATFLQALATTFASGNAPGTFTTAELEDAVQPQKPLRAALPAALATALSQKMPGAAVGKELGRRKGTPYGGLVLVRDHERAGSTVWKVEPLRQGSSQASPVDDAPDVAADSDPVDDAAEDIADVA